MVTAGLCVGCRVPFKQGQLIWGGCTAKVKNPDGTVQPVLGGAFIGFCCQACHLRLGRKATRMAYVFRQDGELPEHQS